MLDEDEFASIDRLYRECVQAAQGFRKKHRLPLKGVALEEHFQPVQLRDEELTGLRSCHQDAILHHRLSLYGALCRSCGKPLRTSKTKICGACMTTLEASANTPPQGGVVK
jgi:hypothetical protein